MKSERVKRQAGSEDVDRKNAKIPHTDDIMEESEAAAGSHSESLDYGKRKKQVPKEFMYMMTALWMEQSPWSFKDPQNRLNIVGEEGKLNVVGAVFVLPNDRVLSVDCSRENKFTKAIQLEEDEGIVHGGVQALIKYPDRVKDCKVYLSRKPCANCAKMLVQAEVKKVFYLPLRPEKEEDGKSVDALFQVSTVSRCFFVPDITESDLNELENSKKPYGKRIENLGEQREKYAEGEWDKWKEDLQKQLAWEEYGDKGIVKQVVEDMKRMFQWFGWATFATGREEVMKWEPHKKPSSELPEAKVASHLSRLAQMLSIRTDDPKRNVGCVIAVDKEIVSVGWNGFPSKALYGNHPRGSRADSAKKKYPRVIHAEQNALLCRNRRDLTKGIAYVNKIPCNECMPMLYQLGVQKVVLPEVGEKPKDDSETYFYKLLKENQISVFTQVK